MKKVLILLTVLMALGFASSAYAVSNYSVVATLGQPYVGSGPGNLYNIAVPSGAWDDQPNVTLSSSLSGVQHLPFKPLIYGARRGTIQVSPNGVIFIGNGATFHPAFSNTCLATNTLSPGIGLAVYWDDWFYDRNNPNITNPGIFVSTKGTAPNRRYVISFKGTQISNMGALLRAEVIFNESNGKIEYRYADGVSNASTTIGIQQSPTDINARNYTCNGNPNNFVGPGLKLTWTPH